MRDNVGITYDYKQFNVNNGQTDYDVKSNQSDLFNNVPVGKKVVIFTNVDVTIKFNNSNLPGISLPVTRSPWQTPQDFLEINNIFITNSSGSTATIEILLA